MCVVNLIVTLNWVLFIGASEALGVKVGGGWVAGWLADYKKCVFRQVISQQIQ